MIAALMLLLVCTCVGSIVVAAATGNFGSAVRVSGTYAESIAVGSAARVIVGELESAKLHSGYVERATITTTMVEDGVDGEGNPKYKSVTYEWNTVERVADACVTGSALLTDAVAERLDGLCVDLLGIEDLSATPSDVMMTVSIPEVEGVPAVVCEFTFSKDDMSAVGKLRLAGDDSSRVRATILAYADVLDEVPVSNQTVEHPDADTTVKDDITTCARTVTWSVAEVARGDVSW